MAVDLAMELTRKSRRQERLKAAAGDGPRVLVCRPIEQSAELVAALRARHLAPVVVPAISVEIIWPNEALERALAEADPYDWLVVTSANGVRAIFEVARRSGARISGLRWAVVGSSTAAAVEAEGLTVAFRPSQSSGHSMSMELPVLAGERVLVVSGDLATDQMANRLRSRRAEVDEVVVYRTIEAPEASQHELRQAFVEGPIDAVIFTSGSTVRGLLALAGDDGHVKDLPAICIGPETAREAERAGFHVIAISSTQDATTLARSTAAALGRINEETA